MCSNNRLQNMLMLNLSAGLVFSAIAPQAAANDGAPGMAGRIAAELTACRGVADAAQRLACYDRAASTLERLRADGEVVLLDREGVREAKRAVFGFSIPRIRLFGQNSGREEPEVQAIESSLAQVRPAGHGLFLLSLADGSQWQTTEARTGFFPSAGMPIKVTAGILGSYVASIDGGRGMRAKRVR